MHVLFTTVQIASPLAAPNAATYDAVDEKRIVPADKHDHLASEPSAEMPRHPDECPYADLADPDCADWT